MRAAIISLGSKSTLMTLEEMNNYFSVVDLLDIRNIEISVGSGSRGILYKGEPLGDYDCVYIKGSFKYSAIQRSIATQLRDKCYIPYSTNTFSVVHDKLLTHLELEKKNIPMPKTYISSTTKSAKILLTNINYPIIMKIPQGTQGKGVMFADSFAAATSMLDTLDALKQPFIIQEFIETNGSDIRALVVGDEVVACMKRHSSGEDKRSNLHAGGFAERYIPDFKVKKIAIDTAKALKAEICGVDILEGHKGPLVIEANLSPGLQGITSATGINVAEKIARYLAIKTEEFLDKKKRENSVDNILVEAGIRKTIPTNETLNQDLKEKNLETKESKESPKNDKNNLISALDFRGERILLPEIVSKFSKFKDDVEYLIEYSEGNISIKKL